MNTEIVFGVKTSLLLKEYLDPRMTLQSSWDWSYGILATVMKLQGTEIAPSHKVQGKGIFPAIKEIE